MLEHGTRIIIYNLWEDDEGQLELDFDTDPHVSFQIDLFSFSRAKNIHRSKGMHFLDMIYDIYCLLSTGHPN